MDHEKVVRIGLSDLESKPHEIDASSLARSVVYLLSHRLGIMVAFAGTAKGEIRFNARCIAFRIRFLPKTRDISIEYRHMEAVDWVDAKYMGTADKVVELIDLVREHTITSPPRPVGEGLGEGDYLKDEDIE